MASRDVLKVSASHYKLDSRTDDEFEAHIHNNVNPAWIEHVHKHGVFKYSITFCPSALTAGMAENMDKVRPEWGVDRAHAIFTYYVRDVEHMYAIIGDPDFQKVGRDSEVGWIDQSRGEIRLGYERVYIDDGKIVE